jgi:hypothetical protein
MSAHTKRDKISVLCDSMVCPDTRVFAIVVDVEMIQNNNRTTFKLKSGGMFAESREIVRLISIIFALRSLETIISRYRMTPEIVVNVAPIDNYEGQVSLRKDICGHYSSQAKEIMECINNIKYRLGHPKIFHLKYGFNRPSEDMLSKHLKELISRLFTPPMDENKVGVFITFQNDIRIYNTLLERVAGEVRQGRSLRVLIARAELELGLSLCPNKEGRDKLFDYFNTLGAEYEDVSIYTHLQGKVYDGLGMVYTSKWEREKKSGSRNFKYKANDVWNTEAIARLIYGNPLSIDIQDTMKPFSRLSRISKIYGDVELEAVKGTALGKPLERFLRQS